MSMSIGTEKTEVFIQRPIKFNPFLKACACHVEVGSKYLFLQKSEGRWSQNLWGVPCGRIEKGEGLYHCMVRELKEEIGLEVKREVLDYLTPLYVVKPEVSYTFHLFYLKLNKEIEVTLSDEHKDFRWLSFKKALSLPLIPGQKEVFSHFFELRKEFFLNLKV
jgi:8-oxo-dGTP pyrophosphatase MutT (NUDIX family)